MAKQLEEEIVSTGKALLDAIKAQASREVTRTHRELEALANAYRQVVETLPNERGKGPDGRLSVH